jgi:hypothetical protein
MGTAGECGKQFSKVRERNKIKIRTCLIRKHAKWLKLQQILPGIFGILEIRPFFALMNFIPSSSALH